MIEFFDGFTWQALVGLFFAALAGLFPAMNIFNQIKEHLGLEGRKANLLVQVLSVAITALAMFFTDELNIVGLEFNLVNILAFAGMLYSASQFAYSAFKDGLEDPQASWGPGL